MAKRSNFSLANPVSEHATPIYAEHVRRTTSFRLGAKIVRFQYPLMALFLFGVPLFAIAFAISFILSTGQPASVVNLVPIDYHLMISKIAYVVAASISILSFLVGIQAGITKARDLIFKAEEIEMKLRQEFYAAQLAQVVNQSAPETDVDQPRAYASGSNSRNPMDEVSVF